MRCLLDTHTLLWARSAPDLLSAQAVAALQSGCRHKGHRLRSMPRWAQFVALALGQLSGRCCADCATTSPTWRRERCGCRRGASSPRT